VARLTIALTGCGLITRWGVSWITYTDDLAGLVTAMRLRASAMITTSQSWPVTSKTYQWGWNSLPVDSGC
jgi:hypothetical protein